MDDPRAVGERLRAAREAGGLSQRQLAFPGCSPAYISRIEAGDRIPSLQLLRELGRRLGVSEDYLATGAEETAGVVSRQLMDAEIALRLDDLERSSALYGEVLDGAGTDGDRAAALEGLGNIALRNGEAREAVDLFERSLDLSGGNECDRPTLAASLARAYGALDEAAPAIALLERCADRYEREGDTVQYVRFACLLGYALTDAGDFAGAERVVAKALRVGGELTDAHTRARLYWSQSRLLGEQGRSDASARYAELALDTLRATEDTYYVALAHQLLAQAYLDAGRSTEAAEVLDEGRPLIESSASPLELAHYRVEQARALAALGDKEEAAALAMEISGKLGNEHPMEAGRVYVLLAEIFDEIGEPARARELYELGIERLERDNPNRYVIGAYKRLAALLESEGRSDEALAMLKRALSVQERAGRPIA